MLGIGAGETCCYGVLIGSIYRVKLVCKKPQHITEHETAQYGSDVA
jgi:hypothetical protein